ncbi:MAG TPA: ribosome biogenesis GTPase YlqF, partial [Bacillota bacterium]|nr:ribosome biogenesis GTPase YlqF [Bacillota bacterium]
MKGFHEIMQGNPIQWFPGHMAKTRRRIREDLKLVDAVVELLDARIPISSKNPDIKSILGNKPTLTLLNKSSLADPVVTEKWIAAIRKENGWAAAIDCSTGEGINKIVPILTSMLSDKITRWRERGMVGRKIKVMVVGIPNVGKSTFINKLAGARKAKAEDRPGVTRDTQWVEVDKK